MAPYYEVETGVIGRVSKERELSCGDLVYFPKRVWYLGTLIPMEIIIEILNDDILRILRDEGDTRRVLISDPKSSLGINLTPRCSISGLCQEIYRQNVFVYGQGLRARRLEWREK